VVDGTVYVQASADAERLIGKTFGDARPGSPFFRIVAVGEVDYVDSEMDEGNTVHHLVVTKWLGGSGTEYRMVGAGRLADRAGRLDIWVTNAGVPMRARSVTTFSLQQGGVLGQFATDLTLTFDDWGTSIPSVRRTLRSPNLPPIAGGRPEADRLPGVQSALPTTLRTRSPPSAWPRPRARSRRLTAS